MSGLGSVLLIVLKFIAGLFTMKEPIKNPIDRPEPEVPVDDGKTDKERLDDFGL